MFAVEEKHKRINDKIVETFERSVMGHHTELLAEAGTTGYKGTPCRKAGGRTYLSLVCMEGDFHFEPVTSDDGEIFGIEIACCGDDALASLIDSLGFSIKALIDQCDETDE